MTQTNNQLIVKSVTVGGGGGGGSIGNITYGGDIKLVSADVDVTQCGTEAVVIRYPGPPKFIGGTIKYENDVTVHVFTVSATLEPIRRSTLATRWACKTLSVMEAWGCVPKLPAIQNWWSAHKASDAARGITSGGGGC